MKKILHILIVSLFIMMMVQTSFAAASPCVIDENNGLGQAKDFFDTSIGIKATGVQKKCIVGQKEIKAAELPYEGFYKSYLSDSNTGSFEAPLYRLIRDGLNLLIWIMSAAAGVYVLLAGFRIVAGGLTEDILKNQTVILRNIVIGVIVMNMANVFVGTVFFTYDPKSTEATQITTTYQSYQDLNNRLAALDQNSANASSPLTKFDPASAANSATKWSAKTAPLLISQTVVFPLMQFFLGFLAAVIILYIIVSAFKIIMARGDSEEVIGNARRQILNAMIGLALVFASRAIVNTIYGTPFVNPSKMEQGGVASENMIKPQVVEGMGTLMNIMNYLLGFFAVIGLVMFIYAGILIVTSGANEENRKKGFTVMKWTVISMLMSMSAYAIVSTVLKLSI